MESFIQTSESFLSIKDWMDQYPNLLAGFTTKNGGVSESPFDSMNTAFHVSDMDEKVRENRRILANQLHLPLDKWVGAEQTHRQPGAVDYGHYAADGMGVPGGIPPAGSGRGHL